MPLTPISPRRRSGHAHDDVDLGRTQRAVNTYPRDGAGPASLSESEPGPAKAPDPGANPLGCCPVEEGSGMIEAVRSRFRTCCLLALCVVGSGAQWDLLQVFAWEKMVVGHMRTMSLSASVAKTFDGEMCPICRMVARAKAQEQPHPAAPDVKADGKILLFFQAPPTVVLDQPAVATWRPVDCLGCAELRWAPPVPPPRTVV